MKKKKSKKYVKKPKNFVKIKEEANQKITWRRLSERRVMSKETKGYNYFQVG